MHSKENLNQCKNNDDDATFYNSLFQLIAVLLGQTQENLCTQ